MISFRSALVVSSVAVSFLVPSLVFGATGTCDSSPAAPAACSAALNAANVVVNDVFKDSNGLSAVQVRTATPFNAFGECAVQVPTTGCVGVDDAPYDCPGQFTCSAVSEGDFPTTFAYALSVDHQWWQTCRLAQTALDAKGCPTAGCIANGTGGNYVPWLGLLFDLTGPSNGVAVFAANNAGPQPCESTEVTVFLTNDPTSRAVVMDPATSGVDPTKWNRAKLSKVFTGGWQQVRAADPAGHAACGDTATYPVEEDSFVTVFSLPSGGALRYAAVVAGNDGLDFPACAYDSNDAEIDAIAGLTETGASVCPDGDNDGSPDCNCPGAPAVCDCNDQNPNVHPGPVSELECLGTDLNCDGMIRACGAEQMCTAAGCVNLDAGTANDGGPIDDAGVDGGAGGEDAGAVDAGGGADAGAVDAGTGGSTSPSGCGCDGTSSAAPSFAAFVAIAAGAARRRRRGTRS